MKFETPNVTAESPEEETKLELNQEEINYWTKWWGKFLSAEEKQNLPLENFLTKIKPFSSLSEGEKKLLDRGLGGDETKTLNRHFNQEISRINNEGIVDIK